MRIKIDENLPKRARSIFVEAGHDVDTVEEEGLSGSHDPTVSRAATLVQRLVVTLDRGFGDLQRYPPGTHAGILVLRIDDQSAGSVAASLTALVASTNLDALAGCVAVFRDGNLRVRRPADN